MNKKAELYLRSRKGKKELLKAYLRQNEKECANIKRNWVKRIMEKLTQ